MMIHERLTYHGEYIIDSLLVLHRIGVLWNPFAVPWLVLFSIL